MKATTAKRIPLLAALAAGLVLVGCGNGDAHHDASMHATDVSSAQSDIVDTAVAAGDFNTLVTAVKEAGLVETLKGEGPYTVFAPTDAAFARLPAGALEALLADRDKLRAVLLYHVVPGKVMAADVVKVSSAKTAQGSSVAIRTHGDQVHVDNATVVKTDIECSNGVIHVIDSVILPPSE